METLPPETVRVLNDLSTLLHDPTPLFLFRCLGCRHTISRQENLIQDLLPFSGTHFLVDSVIQVRQDESVQSIGVYVGAFPDGTHVDLIQIYCLSCSYWMGWQIIKEYEDHPIIRPTQYILVDAGVQVASYGLHHSQE